MRARVASTLLAGLLACCTRDRTQLVVWIDSDLPRQGVGAIERLDIRVEGPSGDAFERTVDLGDDSSSLPASFGVRPRDGDATRVVRVDVEGEAGSAKRVRARAMTSFIENRRLRLDLFLYAACLAEPDPCPQDMNCVAGECVPAFRDPGELPEWSGPVEPPSFASEARVAVAGDSTLVAGATGPDGTVLIVGSVRGDVTFEDGDEQAPVEAGFVTAYGPDRRLSWRKVLAGSGSVVLQAVTTSAEGDVIVAGTYNGTAAFTDPPLPPSAGRGFLVARLARDDGSVMWAQGWPSRSITTSGPAGLAVRGEDLAIVGSFATDLSLDASSAPTFTGNDLGTAVLLVASTTSGEIVCAKDLRNPMWSFGLDVRAEANGWAMAGFFDGVVGQSPDLDLGEGVTIDDDTIQPAFLSRWDAACRPYVADSLSGLFQSTFWPAPDVVVASHAGQTTTDPYVAFLDENLDADPIPDPGGEAIEFVLTAGVAGGDVLLGGYIQGGATHLFGVARVPVDGSMDGFLGRVSGITRRGEAWLIGGPGNDTVVVALAGPVTGSVVVAANIGQAARGAVVTDLPVDLGEIAGPGTILVWVRP